MSKQIEKRNTITEEAPVIKRYIFDWDLQSRGEIWTPNENLTAPNLDRLTDENDEFLNLRDHEWWETDEIDRIIGLIDGTKSNMTKDERSFQRILRNALWNNELELDTASQLVKFINNKRVLDIGDSMVIIPRCLVSEENADKMLCDFNIRLLNIAITYRKIEIGTKSGMDVFELNELKDRFYGQLNALKFRISAGIFSKDFKKMYQMKFNGYTSVALTDFLDLDEVYIPNWYAKKHKIRIGDTCLMFRHPIQNIFIAVKVAGFTGDGTIRVNSLVFTWLGGDHDGDKVEIVPVKVLIKDNEEFFGDGRKEAFLEEIERLLPSNICKDAELSELIPGEPTEEDYELEIYSLEEMLDASEKSQKYVDEIDTNSYLENQKGTVLNMRTVKDGTGIAGFFCNNLMETTELAGEDLITARNICNIIQQAALDSKHDAATGKGYEATVWAKIATLFNNTYGLKQLTEQGIVEKLIDIMEETDSEIIQTNLLGEKSSAKNRKRKKSAL